MSIARRKDDLDACTRFRTDRFCQEGGKWYFLTREGTIEGPFDHRRAAENRLEDYLRVMASGLISPDNGLSIIPNDPSRPF